jgi:hypothetical protein
MVLRRGVVLYFGVQWCDALQVEPAARKEGANEEDDYLPLTFSGGGFGGGVGARPDPLDGPSMFDNYSLLRESLVRACGGGVVVE